MHRIDLNCDLGELEGDDGLALDAAILPLISSANVACGTHAGSVARIRQLAILCRKHSVNFGAHPGYPDRDGFGRTVMPMTPQQITNLVAEQVNIASEIADSAGVRVSHVKPHGALYNLAAQDFVVAAAIAAAVRRHLPEARFIGLAGSELIEAGRAASLITTSEIFADRNYRADGSLVPRDQPAAILHNAQVIAERVVDMILTGSVRTVEGELLSLAAESVCVHGDTPDSAEIVIRIRRELEENGIAVLPPEAAM